LSSPDCRQLYELFTDFGFRRYADDMHSALMQNLEQPEEAARQWTCIDTPPEFEGLLTELLKQPVICVDLETTSQVPMLAEIVGWAISWQAGESYYIPVDGPPGTRVL